MFIDALHLQVWGAQGKGAKPAPPPHPQLSAGGCRQRRGTVPGSFRLSSVLWSNHPTPVGRERVLPPAQDLWAYQNPGEQKRWSASASGQGLQGPGQNQMGTACSKSRENFKTEALNPAWSPSEMGVKPAPGRVIYQILIFFSESCRKQEHFSYYRIWTTNRIALTFFLL